MSATCRRGDALAANLSIYMYPHTYIHICICMHAYVYVCIQYRHVYDLCTFLFLQSESLNFFMFHIESVSTNKLQLLGAWKGHEHGFCCDMYGLGFRKLGLKRRGDV